MLERKCEGSSSFLARMRLSFEVSCAVCDFSDAAFTASRSEVAPSMVVDEEALWAIALAEFDSGNRRPGLWAKVFSDADGNEALAKARYLRIRAGELEAERVTLIAASELEAKRQAQEAALAHLDAEKRAYEMLPKGTCPLCEAVIPLSAEECPRCGALFGRGAVWKPVPVSRT